MIYNNPDSNKLGVIKEGKYADFVVLEFPDAVDIRKVNGSIFQNQVKVVMTVINGTIRYTNTNELLP